MPKFVIEREIPGAGKLTSEQLKGISQTSCGVLNQMGTDIQWLHSYVTGDKIYCVYIAPNEEMILEHASQGGFPANKNISASCHCRLNAVGDNCALYETFSDCGFSTAPLRCKSASEPMACPCQVQSDV